MKRACFKAMIFALGAIVLAPGDAFSAKPPPPVVTCTATTTPVNFGNYDVFLATPLDSTGSVIVTCDATANVTVAIGASSVFPNLIDPRKMASGSNTLNYNLYTDATYTVIWGDGIVGSTVSKNCPKNKATDFIVYGRIPPLQDAAVGAYLDTLTVTVIW